VAWLIPAFKRPFFAVRVIPPAYRNTAMLCSFPVTPPGLSPS
jgi:hypothetical protein